MSYKYINLSVDVIIHDYFRVSFIFSSHEIGSSISGINLGDSAKFLSGFCYPIPFI